MDIQKLQSMQLFRGLSTGEIDEILNALHAKIKSFSKGAVIFHAGTIADNLGLVLDGSVTIESNDLWGNRTILSHVGKGQLFAETYALLENEPMLVDAVANESCRVLFLRVRGMMEQQAAGKEWAFRLLSNLLMISAHKNLTLSGRSFHTSPKSIRGRVMAYLQSASIQKGSREFDIPFDRQQLADYLNLERTALSKELGKMQREGIIKVRKNHFCVMLEAEDV